MIAANSEDRTANWQSGSPRKWRKSAVWPDGGVVTQRTANPPSPRRIADKFARFTPCSSTVLCGVQRAIANSLAISLLTEKAPLGCHRTRPDHTILGGSNG